MLELRDFMPVNFLKKEKFTGSHNGMRFRMEKLDLEGEDGPRLGVNLWAEKRRKEQQILSFDADGIAKGVDWLNEQFEGQKARWKAVSRG